MSTKNQMPPGRDNIPIEIHRARVAVREGRASIVHQRAPVASVATATYEPKGADLHVRMALNCLEELEPEAMRRKARMVRNFNEHAERESQLSAARVSLDRALDLLVAKT